MPDRMHQKDADLERETTTRWLVISQVYVPDPASVGQHMADVAEALASRGSKVVVLTSERGYDNPQIRYPRRERRAGVDVIRLPLSSFGKRSLLHRVLGQILFLAQVMIRGTFTRRLSGIVVSTSPPMAALAALIIGFFRRVPINYWLMDLNPDELVAMGKASPRSPLVAAMKWLNRRIFLRAANVIVLDRFMSDRVTRQYNVKGRLVIQPPWPHNEADDDVVHGKNPFRQAHGLSDRFVVMYSGNHSMVSPVSTLLRAAVEMQNDTRFVFMFIGGGKGKAEVEAAAAAAPGARILSLPYQPLDEIKYSLSAADLHVVTLGNDMPGIIHPCKIYGAMAVGRPVLLIGPRPCHTTDLIDRYEIGWQVNQGDSAVLIETLREIADMSDDERAQMGRRARAAVRAEFSRAHLCNELCDIIERSAVKDRRPNASIDPARRVEAAIQDVGTSTN